MRLRPACMRIKGVAGLPALAVLTASMLATPAYAQWQLDCRSGSTSSTTGQFAGSRGDHGTACMRPFREDRAAVLLPATRDKDAGAGPWAPQRWGFVDGAGALVIKPQFTDVGDFHHGLAKAFDGKQWGYIDTAGKWVIKPQFDEAGNFVDAGMAAVKRDGDWSLIDRAGKRADADLGVAMTNLTISDGLPARVQMTYSAHYQTVDGKNVAFPKGFVARGKFGDNGLIIAQNDTHAGLLAPDMTWRVKPVYDDIDPPEHGSKLGVASGGPDGKALIDADGKVVADHLRAARPLGRGGTWLLTLPHDQYAIANADGKVLSRFDGDRLRDLKRAGNFVVAFDDDKTTIWGPTFVKPLTVDASVLDTLQSPNGHVLVAMKGRKTVGLVLANGTFVRAQGDTAWAGKVASAKMEGQWLWFFGKHHRVVDVVNAEGHFLLSDAVRSKLANFNVQPLPVTQPKGGTKARAIALVTGDRYCHCDATGAGLLLSDGTLQLHDDWTDIKMRSPTPGHDTDAWPISAPRYVFETDAGSGMITPGGKVLLPPEYDNIGTFHHGYAFVFGNGKARVTDVHGKLYDLPRGFNLYMVGAGILQYQKSALLAAKLSLFDLKAQKDIGKTQYTGIAEFKHGTAIAKTATGKMGVIDTRGRWVLKPEYGAVMPINGKLWFVQKPASGAAKDSDNADVPMAVVDADGKIVVPYTKGLKAALWPDGSGRVVIYTYGYSRSDDGTHVLLSADGRVLIDGSKTDFSHVADLVRIRPHNATGYLGQQQQWVIAPGSYTGSPFHADGRALQRVDGKTRIINRAGDVVARLSRGQWQWPEGSDWIMRSSRTNGLVTTTYYDGSGKLVQGARGKATAVAGAGEHDLSAVKLGRHFGYVVADDSVVIPPVYATAGAFAAGDRAVVTTASSAMLINRKGVPVARLTRHCGVRVLYGPDNRRLWPEGLPDVSRCKQRSMAKVRSLEDKAANTP